MMGFIFAISFIATIVIGIALLIQLFDDYTKRITMLKTLFVGGIAVYGMIATENLSSLELTTVRLTPFTETEPFSTVIFPLVRSYSKV